MNIDKNSNNKFFEDFLKVIPENLIQFDNFTILEELSSNQIDKNLMDNFFKKRNNIIDKEVKTIKEI